MTEPNSPETPKEVLKDNPYGETVRGLIEDAPHFNTNQLSRIIESSLIKEITESAEKGEFFSQFEDKETKEIKTVVYSVEDIFSGQIAAALETQDAQPKEPKAWGVNIPRAHGLRDALMTVMQDRQLAEPFRYAVYYKQAELLKAKDGVEQGIITRVPEALRAHPEALYQEVVEDLGEEAVEASGVELEAAAASRIVSLEHQEVQNDPYDYLRKKLPPVVRPEKVEGYDPRKYDYLLTGEGAPVPQSPSFESNRAKPETIEDKQRKYYDRFVTEENRKAAQSMLASTTSSTPEISKILSAHNLSPTSIEAVDAIREDPEVRFEVAKVLVQKLDRILSGENDLGDRITRNSAGNEKADQVRMPIVRMPSQLYVVYMALKMIGGEFSERIESNADALERGPDGVVKQAQHRHAARTILLSQ